MTKEDLIKLITKIRNGEFKTEKERNNIIEKFLQNVPDPEATRLIYYHKPRLTPEEIVEKALAYKPIILPPPDDTIKAEEKNNFGVFSRRKNMTKEELVDLVQAILCDGYYGPEEDDNEDYIYALEWFLRNMPYREAADLIFHHKPRFTPKEIVEKALTYNPDHSSLFE